MAIEVPCLQCGHKNPLGRVFCMNCGVKLDLKAMDPRGKRRSASGAGHALGRFLRLVVSLALLLAIVLILRPVSPSGGVGNVQDAQRLRQKLGLLKGAALDGRSVSQRLSEVEINSYLAKLLQETSDSGRSDLYKLKVINIAMKSGKITVVLVSSIGPLSLSHEFVGTPGRTADRQFEYRVERVRLGQLPMPGALGEWLAGKSYNVFSKMTDEHELLDRMARIDVGSGEIVAHTQGQP